MAYQPIRADIVGRVVAGYRRFPSASVESTPTATIESLVLELSALDSDLLESLAVADNYGREQEEAYGEIVMHLAGNPNVILSKMSTNYGEPAQGSAADELGDTLEEIAALVGAKGVIITHNGTEWVVLAPGDDGNILSANASAPNGIEWVELTEGGALDATLQAIADLTPTTDEYIYFTDDDVAALGTISSFSRTALAIENASGWRTQLAVAIGSNVQAFDQLLEIISTLTMAADRYIYFTGTNSAALGTITSDARGLLEDASYSDMRTTLGLAIGTNVQAWDAQLDALAGVTAAADRLPYFTGASTADVTVLTSFARTLLATANAAAARSILELEIGTDVQAWDADLDTFASLTYAKGSIVLGGAATWGAFPVGNDDEVLIADSAQSAGVRWGPMTSETLGLGTMADQDADDVDITGGEIVGLDTIEALAAVFDSATINGGTIDGAAITGLADPVEDTDAANKQWVEAQILGGISLDPTLDAIAALTPGAGTSIYFTGSDIAATYTLTSAARDLLDDANAAAMRTTLGLAIGTNVQAWDADLDAISGFGKSKGNLIAGTGAVWDTLAAGTDGYVLMLDSGETTGLIWADPGTFGLDDTLVSIGALTPVAGESIYFTDTDEAAVYTLTTQGRQLLDDTSFSAMRTTLGLTIGTNVQAFDAQLTDLAGLTPSKGAIIVGDGTNFTLLGVGTNDQIIYADSTQTTGLRWDDAPTGGGGGGFEPSDLLLAIDALVPSNGEIMLFTGVDTVETRGVSSFGLDFIDLANAGAARTALGLVIGTDVQAQDPELAALAGLTSAADRLPYFTGSGTADLAVFSAFARTFLDDADAAAVRTTLGLVIGTNVQAFDDDLSDLAALSHATGTIIVSDGTDWVALPVGEDGQVLTARSLETEGVWWQDVVGGEGILPPGISALAPLDIDADMIAYYTGASSADLTALTAFARSILDDADATTVLGTPGMSAFIQTLLNDTDAATARATLGLTIGTHVQAYDAQLADIAALAVTDGNIIVGDGANWVAESGATARASLGVTIGAHVQAWDADLDTIAGLSKTKGTIMVANGSAWVALSVGDDDDVLTADAAEATGVKWAPGGVGGGGATAGRHSMWIPSGAITPRMNNNGAGEGFYDSGNQDINIRSLNFDTATQEYAQFQIAFPKHWDEGTVTFQPYWTAASGSGTVAFTLAGVAFSNDDALNTAHGTAQSSSDTLITANDLHVGPESSAITIAGTPAEGDMISFQVSRDVANDTLGVDAILIGIRVFYTTNAENED